MLQDWQSDILWLNGIHIEKMELLASWLMSRQCSVVLWNTKSPLLFVSCHCVGTVSSFMFAPILQQFWDD
jgi:hypothetical protein